MSSRTTPTYLPTIDPSWMGILKSITDVVTSTWWLRHPRYQVGKKGQYIDDDVRKVDGGYGKQLFYSWLDSEVDWKLRNLGRNKGPARFDERAKLCF